MTQEELKDIARCGETTTIQFKEQGADKRRITENSEILTLFQDSGSYQADAAGVTDTNFGDLDRYALNDYLKKVYSLDLDILADKAEQLLKNIHVLNHNGIPTLAGYLFFGKHPEYYCPTFMVKAVSFFGNELAGTQYRDTKEIVGNMPQIYEKSMSFMKSNLHNIQEKGASFNTLGKLEISEEVLEEVLQNALVHRDLLRSAPIRIFIFDNRVEIISPGALAGGLTEDDIRSGKTFQRNPYMATFATNALHYRGIGSGIVRILAEYPEIEIVNDVSGKEFKVIVWRKEHQISTQMSTQKTGNSTQKSTQEASGSTQKTSGSTQEQILNILREYPQTSRKELAKIIGITEDGIKKQLANLKKAGMIERIGADNGGHWEVKPKKK